MGEAAGCAQAIIWEWQGEVSEMYFLVGLSMLDVIMLLSLVILIGFEQREYSFEEENKFVNNSVFVSKGDVLSEQTLNILVQFSSGGFAAQGNQYS